MKGLEKLSFNLNKINFQIKKNSPTILIGVGIAGVVASSVMACKATIKANDILEEKNEQIEKIHECAESKELKESGKYTEEDEKKDLAIVYTKTAVKFAKLYAPSVILGVTSIGCIVYSHNILTKRNAALVTAYGLLDKSFKNYRERVKARVGETAEKEINYNIKAKQVETIDIDENGNKVESTKEVKQVNFNWEDHPYAVIFDECNPNYRKDPCFNRDWLRMQQHYANQKLKSKGVVFLNEVYEMLGFPITKAGQVVGWMYDGKSELGDEYIDFGLGNIDDINVRAFNNGYENSVILDFNVDGCIWDLMK